MQTTNRSTVRGASHENFFSILVVGIADLSGRMCRDPGPKGDSGSQGPGGASRCAGRAGVSGAQGQAGAQDRRGRKVLQGTRAKRAIKGDKGDAGSVNVRAVQGDGPVSCEGTETLVSIFCPSGGAPDGAKCGTRADDRSLSAASLSAPTGYGRRDAIAVKERKPRLKPPRVPRVPRSQGPKGIVVRWDGAGTTAGTFGLGVWSWGLPRQNRGCKKPAWRGKQHQSPQRPDR